MKYTLLELGVVYKIVDLKCRQQDSCKTCIYEEVCPLFNTIEVIIDDYNFIKVAEQILRSV